MGIDMWGDMFGRDDVVAHELGHRVVHSFVPDLPYTFETGAINESLADTFAAGFDTDDWTIGETRTRPDGFRSMEDPGSHTSDIGLFNRQLVPQPAHRDQKVGTSADNGGVHVNSGIPNKAAYLIGSQIGRDKMVDIYLQTLRHHMTKEVNFESFAARVVQSAIDLYGAGSREAEVARDAWRAVGYLQPGDDGVITRPAVYPPTDRPGGRVTRGQ